MTTAISYEIRIDTPLLAGDGWLLTIHGYNTTMPVGAPDKPLERIIIKVELFPMQGYDRTLHALPHAGRRLRYYLGDRDTLTPAQVETICAQLVASGTLPAAFASRQDGHGAHQVVATSSVDHLMAALAAEPGDDMPDGWDRYRVHDASASIIYTTVAPAGTAPDVARVHTRPDGTAAWPLGRPEQVALVRPREYLRRLAGLREQPPIPRRPLAIAAWRAGLHNVRAIADGLGADRTTIYADLRSVDIHPSADR